MFQQNDLSEFISPEEFIGGVSARAFDSHPSFGVLLVPEILDTFKKTWTGLVSSLFCLKGICSSRVVIGFRGERLVAPDEP